MFWWLFLLTALRTAYPYLVFSPPWAYTASPADWFNFFRVLLGQLLWVVGVRLLIEVALALHRPGRAAPETTTPSN